MTPTTQRMQDMKNANTFKTNVTQLFAVSTLALALGASGLSHAATPDAAPSTAKASAPAMASASVASAQKGTTPAAAPNGATASPASTASAAPAAASAKGSAHAEDAKSKKIHNVSENKHASTQHASALKGATHISTPSAKSSVLIK